MHKRRVDPIVIGTVTTLVALGIVMVLSSSSVQALHRYGDTYYFFKRQLLWAIIGLGGLYFFSCVDYRHWARWSRLLLFFSLVVLVIVLFPQIGRIAGGSRRWLVLGPLVFQPSEIAKFSLVLYLAAYISQRRDRFDNFLRGPGPPLALVGVFFFLILKEPDLGTAVTIAGTTVLMLFAAGVKMEHLACLGLGSLPVLYYFVMGEEYRRQRVLSFLDPWQDPLDTGFHIIQSLYALGSGGLFGLGFGQSKQKFLYLPTPSNDFIFAVIGEELGLLGTGFIVALFFVLAWRGFVIALNAPDTFGMLLASGITTMVVLQALINIAVVTGSIPVTGISLPFISYGGSSLVIMLCCVGILLNISRQARY